MPHTITPLDESGQPVDWWFLYKAPKLSEHHHQTVHTTGYEYLYFDPVVDVLKPSPFLLTDGKGALDLTLARLFNDPHDATGWILYNDEMPERVDRSDHGNLGHTKGVLAFNLETETALWLLHSWPKYSDPQTTILPTPLYGQTFLCIALDLDTARAIAAQMIDHQEPQTYFPRLPEALQSDDALFSLSQKLNPNVAGDSDVIDCHSRDGLAFKVLAKNRKWNRDFWNELVGPTLGVDMAVETWIRGAVAPTLDSDGVHKIVDVKYIDTTALGGDWVWPETKDHAKWGLGIERDWVCVGDINRMISQRKRGGGTIAFQNQTLWQSLSKTDLIVPPEGHTHEHAKAMIKATHS